MEPEDQAAAFNALNAAWTLERNGSLSAVQQSLSSAGANITLSTMYGSVLLSLSSASYGEPVLPPGLTSYSSHLAYVGSGQLFGQLPFAWTGQKFTFTVTTKSTSGRVLMASPVDFTFSRSYAKGAGGCKYGRSNGDGDCVIYFFPSPQGLCLSVDTSAVPWRVTGGCAISSVDFETVMTHGTFDLTEQRANAMAYSFTSSPGSFYWPAAVPIVIREARDPWVYAAQATLGSMVLGYPHKRLHAYAGMLLAIAAALLTPTAIVAACVCCGASCETLASRKRGAKVSPLACCGSACRRTATAFNVVADGLSRATDAMIGSGRGGLVVADGLSRAADAMIGSGRGGLGPGSGAGAAGSPRKGRDGAAAGGYEYEYDEQAEGDQAEAALIEMGGRGQGQGRAGSPARGAGRPAPGPGRAGRPAPGPGPGPAGRAPPPGVGRPGSGPAPGRGPGPQFGEGAQYGGAGGALPDGRAGPGGGPASPGRARPGVRVSKVPARGGGGAGPATVSRANPLGAAGVAGPGRFRSDTLGSASAGSRRSTRNLRSGSASPTSGSGAGTGTPRTRSIRTSAVAIDNPAAGAGAPQSHLAFPSPMSPLVAIVEDDGEGEGDRSRRASRASSADAGGRRPSAIAAATAAASAAAAATAAASASSVRRASSLGSGLRGTPSARQPDASGRLSTSGPMAGRLSMSDSPHSLSGRLSMGGSGGGAMRAGFSPRMDAPEPSAYEEEPDAYADDGGPVTMSSVVKFV